MKTKEEIRKELIKILEDTPMYMTRDIEEAVKTKKVLEIAIKNPKKIADKILKLFSQQKREMVVNVSSLRQWLNEDRITDSKKMVTNKEILIWFKQNITK